jgi:hypothetical protein
MEKAKLQRSDLISLPRFAGNGAHIADDSYGTVLIGSHNKWLHMEAPNEHHRSPEVDEGMAKLP